MPAPSFDQSTVVDNLVESSVMTLYRLALAASTIVEVVVRFALVNNERVEAEPKLKGVCPGCLQPVIAKCGTRRIWHWAHRTEGDCHNTRWETEGEWHRAWKNRFPREWQEFVQYDNSGVKHVADVRTPHGLVIEFQYSRLDPKERTAREHFHGNMVWVVDGTRLKNDYPRFRNTRPHRTRNNRVFLAPDKCFPADWRQSAVLVFFDFRGLAPTDPSDTTPEFLWCLLPGRAEGHAVVVAMKRSEFVALASNQPQLLPIQEIVSSLAKELRRPRATDMLDEVKKLEMKMQLRRQQDMRRRRTTRRF